MSWFSSKITEVGPKVFAAVTAEIGAYFKRQSLFRVQFLLPTLAFLAGCLGVVVAITGPDLYLTWWPALPVGLKVVIGALLVALALLVLQASSSLLISVRRLYSQGWPRLTVWQQWLRKPFLESRLDQEREVQTLQRAWAELKSAGRALAGPPGAVGAAYAAPQEVNRRYPVPRTGVSAYQLISGEDWVWADLPEKGKAILAPAELVGRYALGPLPAGQPVSRDSVCTPHDLRYLDKGARRPLCLSVLRTETGPYLETGALVTLYITPRYRTMPVGFDDLLVLARPTEGEIVLSVQQDRLPEVVSLLPGARLTFVRSPDPPEPHRVSVPVVAGLDCLKPGQPIGAEQIHWRTPKDGEGTSGVPASAAQVECRFFWPHGDGFRCYPDLDENTQAAGTAFLSSTLVKIQHPEWLTYPDPATGQTRYRLAYKLSLAKSDRCSAAVFQETRTGPKTDLTAVPATEAFPIAPGDRVTVELEVAGSPTVAERWCYVYAVDRQNGFIYIAVRDRTAFHAQVVAASAIVLSPLCNVPVLKEKRGPGQLIGEEMIKLVEHRASGVPGDVCLTFEEVVDRYVESRDGVQAGWPVPRSSMGAVPTKPADWTWLAVPLGNLPAGEPRPPRGALVSVEIVLPDARLNWEKAFVRGEASGCLVVAAPGDDARVAQGLWPLGAQARLRVTHSDLLAGQVYARLEKRVRDAERPDHVNRALSAANPDETRLEEQAAKLRELAGALRTFLAALADRPWQEDSAAEGFRRTVGRNSERLAWRLRGALTLWTTAIERILEQRQLAMEASLPDNPAETCPTELGNILAAAADHAETAYKIDVACILPRLLAALKEDDPEVVRLANAEEAMNTLLLFSWWSAVWAVLGAAALLLFRGPTWAFPAVLAGGVFLWYATKRSAVARAYAYADALKALFDLKRRALLQQMGFKLPDAMTPQEEGIYWESLTRLFSYGRALEDFPATKVKE